MLLAPLAVIKCIRAQLDAYRDLNGRHYELLVKLYGPSARFEPFLQESKGSATEKAEMAHPTNFLDKRSGRW